MNNFFKTRGRKAVIKRKSAIFLAVILVLMAMLSFTALGANENIATSNVSAEIKKLKYFHSIFHCFVLAGTFIQFFAVLKAI